MRLTKEEKLSLFWIVEDWIEGFEDDTSVHEVSEHDKEKYEQIKSIKNKLEKDLK
jgi:hypothetical protein